MNTADLSHGVTCITLISISANSLSVDHGFNTEFKLIFKLNFASYDYVLERI